jgi:hypothetical protein
VRHHAPVRRIGLVLVLVVVALVAALAVLLLRPPAVARSTVHPDVAIECSAASGLDAEACAAWGDELLAGGAPSRTFELEDVVRIRLDGGFIGDGCSVKWFLGRYPDDPAWTDEAACGVTSSD